MQRALSVDRTKRMIVIRSVRCTRKHACACTRTHDARAGSGCLHRACVLLLRCTEAQCLRDGSIWETLAQCAFSSSSGTSRSYCKAQRRGCDSSAGVLRVGRDRALQVLAARNSPAGRVSHVLSRIQLVRGSPCSGPERASAAVGVTMGVEDVEEKEAAREEADEAEAEKDTATLGCLAFMNL